MMVGAIVLLTTLCSSFKYENVKGDQLETKKHLESRQISPIISSVMLAKFSKICIDF